MSKRHRRGLPALDSPSVPVNKRLNFDLHVEEDDNDLLNELSSQFDIELERLASDEELEQFDKFSPCRTRSGLVYESGNKKHKFRLSSSRGQRKLRSRTLSGQSGTGHLADCSENESETSNVDYTEDLIRPPPLNYFKPAVSRFSQIREKAPYSDIPSSPISSNMMEDHKSPVKEIVGKWPREPRNLFSDGHSPFNSPSPPSHTMRAMRLFDGLGSPNSACAISSPKSAPKLFNLKSRLLFEEDGARRASFPASLSRNSLHECDSTSTSEKPKLANINPFTPEGMVASNRKRNRSQASSIDTSFSSNRSGAAHPGPVVSAPMDSDEESESDRDRHSPLPTKRVRVSDINITRYQEEFLELAEIASGEFGVVKKARHRLDGMVYAIKVSKKQIRKNSHDEKMAMNEVFAHAALMKHKHVVRYYNSWVENGAIFIQNEYCEGGSLQRKIEDHRRRKDRFTEGELRRILSHVAKGLQYIHSKQLVHLDIKPGNIFISLDSDAPSPQRIVEQQTTDSGAASGDFSPHHDRHSPELGAGGFISSDSSPGDSEKVSYKIGDLGHVAPVNSGAAVTAEEGDCRYMAPEFLQMDVDPSKLAKADIFSLGLTIYEAASLKVLPRNSLDDPNYENIKRGNLQYLHCFSEDFNNLILSMVNPDPNLRPTAARIISSSDASPGLNKSRSQLYKELRETREKLMLLEEQLSGDKRRSQRKQR